VSLVAGGRHTTYENACAGPSLPLNCECATATRSMCLYNKSFKIYRCFCNFVSLSFMWGKCEVRRFVSVTL